MCLARAVSVFLLLFVCRAAAETKGTFILTCLEIPDVQRGAGLAIVLQLPSGKTCLYDTGSAYPDASSADGWQASFNAGRDLIVPFLAKAGIKEIDTVFISHAHYDHFGGLMWLKDHFPIKKLSIPDTCFVVRQRRTTRLNSATTTSCVRSSCRRPARLRDSEQI